MDDLVKGTILSAESKTAEGEIFYLSDGIIYSNEEITEAIASTLGSKPVRLKNTEISNAGDCKHWTKTWQSE